MCNLHLCDTLLRTIQELRTRSETERESARVAREELDALVHERAQEREELQRLRRIAHQLHGFELELLRLQDVNRQVWSLARDVVQDLEEVPGSSDTDSQSMPDLEVVEDFN